MDVCTIGGLGILRSAADDAASSDSRRERQRAVSEALRHRAVAGCTHRVEVRVFPLWREKFDESARDCFALTQQLEASRLPCHIMKNRMTSTARRQRDLAQRAVRSSAQTAVCAQAEQRDRPKYITRRFAKLTS